MPRIPLRWVAISVFLFSSALNYLDRSLLAAVAPALKLEFHLTNQDYGKIVSVFSILYATVAPLAGFIHRPRRFERRREHRGTGLVAGRNRHGLHA